MADSDDEVNPHAAEDSEIDPTSPEYVNDPRYKYARKLWVRSRMTEDNPGQGG